MIPKIAYNIHYTFRVTVCIIIYDPINIYFQIFLFHFQTEAPLIEFYKARIAYFYGGNVEMADFTNIDEVIRRETNRRVTMKTNNAVKDFMHHDHPKPEAPMALFAANYFKVISGQSFQSCK